MTIAFRLPTPAQVDLAIYDPAGRRVRGIDANLERPAGSHSVSWDCRDDAGRRLRSGVYFARLRAGRETRIRPIVLLH